jgi:hypothetical protein
MDIWTVIIVVVSLAVGAGIQFKFGWPFHK